MSAICLLTATSYTDIKYKHSNQKCAGTYSYDLDVTRLPYCGQHLEHTKPRPLQAQARCHQLV